MVNNKDMKAEKVVIVKEEKVPQNQKLDVGWEPYEPNLPEVVRRHLDKWLDTEQMKRRKKAVERALLSMVNEGLMRERTIILYLRGVHKGEVVEKEFTFYKSVPERMIR